MPIGAAQVLYVSCRLSSCEPGQNPWISQSMIPTSFYLVLLPEEAPEQRVRLRGVVSLWQNTASRGPLSVFKLLMAINPGSSEL